MYRAEAQLFLSANNNINSAKSLINECKRLISEAELPNNSDYTNCKNCINDCNIKGLSELVETTKEELFRLDQEFAGEYMALLQSYLNTDTIDISNMTEEEQLEYNIQLGAYYRDYNYNLLYMLEKYEATGQLTPALEAQLESQRALIRQYEIQDEMTGLLPTSRRYIELFEENAELDRKIINLNPDLTVEQRTAMLAEYNDTFYANLEILNLNHEIAGLTDDLKEMTVGTEEYYQLENEIRELQIEFLEGKSSLTTEEQQLLQNLYDGVELNELYIDKERNNGFFHPFVEGEIDEAILDQKIKMGIATDAEIAYDQMNGWERAWEDTKTFVTSTAFGIGSVTESLVDGTVMAVSAGGALLGFDTKWAEDFVSISFSTDAYTGLVKSGGINEVAAYSNLHTVGNTLGSVTGYVSLSLLPGGKVTTAITGGLSAAGSSSERAFLCGADWNQAFAVSAVSGTIGAVTGYGVGGGITKGATTLQQVVGKTFLGAGFSALEPIANSATEYVVYANDIKDANGVRVYDNIFDYYVNGGGLTSTIMAFGAGMISSGLQSYKGYQSYKATHQAISELDAFFEQYRSNLTGYGTDQHIAANIVPVNNNSTNFGEFRRLVDKLKNMGMPADDAILFLRELDGAGACSYASFVNEIFCIYRNNSDAFEATFGFSMFTYLDDGTKVLNSAELLTDLYMFANLENNGGRLLHYDADGSLRVNEAIMNDRVALSQWQQYMAYDDFRNVNLINSYLNSKSPNLFYESFTETTTISKMHDTNPVAMSVDDINRMKGSIQYYLDSGYPISLAYYQYNNSPYSITMYDLDGGPNKSTRTWNEGIEGNDVAGHSVIVTGVTDTGFVVSSWGKKYLITFDELKFMPFGLTISRIVSS